MQKQTYQFPVVVKIVISFLIVPTIPATIFTGIFIAQAPKMAFEKANVVGVLFLLAYVLAAGHVFVLGIPSFLLGKWLNTINWWSCIIMAFLIGGLPNTIWTLQARSEFDWSAFIPWGLFGVSGGFVFWLLWKFWIQLDYQRNT